MSEMAFVIKLQGISVIMGNIVRMGIFLTALFLLACETLPEEIPPNLDKRVFFKDAQEYMDGLAWETAKLYLNEFKQRFPNDRADILAADYQLGLIAYKQGQYGPALETFKEILAIYENDDSGELHEWVRVLSEKLLARIEPPENS